MSEPIFFAGAAEWRSWLASHHDIATECVVGFHKTATGKASLTWSESVDQALCFGWIDGVRRRVDERSYTIRFTPRKAGSNWSAINVKKMTALEASGLMTESGRVAFAKRSKSKTGVYSYERVPQELRADELRRFKDSPGWAFFEQQAPWYRRTSIHWVATAKRETTRIKRLEQLIADSEAGRRLRQLSR